MERVLDRAHAQRFVGVRLVQAAYHNRSLSMYTKLGFDAREPLSVRQGPALKLELPGYRVRSATVGDLDACNRLCQSVHGHERSREVADAIVQGTARVVERDDRVTGYATNIGYFAHAVGRTNEELKALIGAAPAFVGPGFLLPTRNADLFRWCLAQGLRVVHPMTLMSRGSIRSRRGVSAIGLVLIGKEKWHQNRFDFSMGVQVQSANGGTFPRILYPSALNRSVSLRFSE
jgi:hypothetical protein